MLLNIPSSSCPEFWRPYYYCPVRYYLVLHRSRGSLRPCSRMPRPPPARRGRPRRGRTRTFFLWATVAFLPIIVQDHQSKATFPLLSCLVKVRVIIPASLWVEPHPPSISAAPAVGLAVGADRVPGEADHEGGVGAVVCRPPVLGGPKHHP